MKISYTSPRLHLPCTPWDGPGYLRYLLGTVMQVSPTQAVVLCNLHWYGMPVDDLENGVDAIVFDRLERIDPSKAVVLLRNHEESHPRNGRPIVMVKGPIFGGFVPLGALLEDGRPHPCAGTGFGHSTVLGYPADHSSAWPAGEKDVHQVQEIQQYRFDGRRFDVVASDCRSLAWPLDGWELNDGPLTHALPDGQDLLLAMTVNKPGRTIGLGLTRWRFVDGAWRPVEVTPVSGEDGTCEPSLVRDRDGALVMAGRGAWWASVHRGWITKDQVKAGHLLAWRSTDNGRSWHLLMDLPRAIQPCPVTINRTVSGRLFFASNPDEAQIVAPNGKTYTPGGLRTRLCLWPLTPDGRSVERPIVALDCPSRFGPTPGGSPWLADHPNGTVVRLADGRLHELLCVRVAEIDETSSGKTSTPQSGCWIDEVIDDGPEMPVWLF